MERLKSIITQYGRWQDISVYIERIETFSESDFSLCVENSKSLLESISKEICCSKGLEVSPSSSINAILRSAFTSLGYSREDLVSQISSSLANIGQQMGNLRNEIGTISHGRTLEEISERNNRIDELTKEFILDTTEIIAIFLIRSFENKKSKITEKITPLYTDNTDFNEYWDSTFGDFSMGDISFTASEILFSLDLQAYLTELRLFQDQLEDET